MAKENNNNSFMIGLLVITGVLLFLVGSFTGNAWNVKPRGLTTAEKQDVLDILGQKSESWAIVEIGQSGTKFLTMGLPININSKIITLEEVGTIGDIAIDVDGVTEVIPSSDTETVNGIEITNIHAYKTLIIDIKGPLK